MFRRIPIIYAANMAMLAMYASGAGDINAESFYLTYHAKALIEKQINSAWGGNGHRIIEP